MSNGARLSPPALLKTEALFLESGTGQTKRGFPDIDL
jgi:hypothetical protein